MIVRGKVNGVRLGDSKERRPEEPRSILPHLQKLS